MLAFSSSLLSPRSFLPHLDHHGKSKSGSQDTTTNRSLRCGTGEERRSWSWSTSNGSNRITSTDWHDWRWSESSWDGLLRAFSTLAILSRRSSISWHSGLGLGLLDRRRWLLLKRSSWLLLWCGLGWLLARRGLAWLSGVGSGGSDNSWWCGGSSRHNTDVASGNGGEDDLRNGDLSLDGADRRRGGDSSSLWSARNSDDGVDDNRGDWSGRLCLHWRLLWTLWNIDNESWVDWHEWCAETLEEFNSGIDLFLGGAVGGKTLENVLGEVLLWAEAVDIRVALALLWQPGV